MTSPIPTPNNMPGAQQAAAAAHSQQAPPAETPPAAPQVPAGGQPPQPAPASGQQPPWGSDAEFNPQRAWDLIQNLRGDKDTLTQQLSAAQPVLDEHERLRLASLDDNERLTEQIAQTNTQVDTWRTHAVRSTVEAMAAGRFVDTETALALIGDVSGFVEGDSIDTTKITAALDKLATDKPFLVTQQQPTGPRGFAPDPSQGQSGAGPDTAMDAQIKAAQDRGDHLTAIALKQQRAAQANTTS